MASTKQVDNMKKATLIIALGLSGSAFAQGHPGMSEADMQKMMQNMQSAQTCMQGVDMAKLDAFGKRARQPFDQFFQRNGRFRKLVIYHRHHVLE